MKENPDNSEAGPEVENSPSFLNPNSSHSLSVSAELEGFAANGGAVSAVVLGVWSILGSLLTYWSLINGILGMVLGFWGLTSKRPRTAWAGIILCVIGIVMSMAAVNDMIANYWIAATDTFNP